MKNEKIADEIREDKTADNFCVGVRIFAFECGVAITRVGLIKMYRAVSIVNKANKDVF